MSKCLGPFIIDISKHILIIDCDVFTKIQFSRRSDENQTAKIGD